MKNATKLIISILICELAGAIGSFFTAPAIGDWYYFLNKPPLNPPNCVFAPVWTILFLLMGVSLYLIWKQGLKNRENKNAVFVFAIQLVLNVFWSVIFFGLKAPGLAFTEIIILWLAILITIIKFFKLSKPAAYLLLPYILWVSFAAVLNFSIWIIN